MAGLLLQLSAISVAFLGTLFVYSGLAKLMALPEFRMGLGRVPYLSRRLLPALTWGIPAAEAVIGVSLMTNLSWAKAFAAIALMGFGIVAAISHNQDQKVPCNCFGVDASEHLSLRTVWRNACFAGIAILTMMVPAGEVTLLSGIYGALAFLLFLAITKTARNRFEFVHGPES